MRIVRWGRVEADRVLGVARCVVCSNTSSVASCRRVIEKMQVPDGDISKRELVLVLNDMRQRGSLVASAIDGDVGIEPGLFIPERGSSQHHESEADHYRVSK